MARKEDNAALKIIIIFLLIVSLCFGWYQLMVGYSEFGGYLASAIIATIIIAMLLGLHIQFFNAWRTNKPVGKILAGYGVILILSICGNFNAFYTAFMGKELLRKELREKIEAFDKLKQDGITALGSYKSIEPQVSNLISQLESQIKNPEERGCGPKCEEVLSELEGILKTKITRLKGRDIPFLINEYKKIINEALKSKIELEGGTEKGKIISEMDNFLTTKKLQIDLAFGSPVDNALPMIVQFVDNYKSFGKRIKNLAGETFQYNEQMTVENAELGRISHAIASALNHLNHWGTWLSLLLSFLVDLIVPLFILISIKRGDASSYKKETHYIEEL